MATDRSLRVTLEAVTPLFLAGAEPRGTPELRPPAFRGALRYWLRAALGGVLGDNLEAVRRAESAVFGSVDEKAGGASGVSVHLAHEALPPPQRYIRERTVSVTRDGRQRQQPTGRDYLYWSMAESGNPDRGNYQSPKQFLQPGSAFEIALRVRPGVREADQTLRQASAALWLLVHLGGVGSRSRRTGGSVSARHEAEAGKLRFALTGRDVGQAAGQLRAGLNTIRQEFGALGAVRPSSPPVFDVLHPDTCRIWVLGMWPRWDMAVNTIGAALRDFRTYREPDHTAVAEWLCGQRIDTVQRAVFGLPLPYRYSDAGPSGVIQGRLSEPAIDRRASPLWLKVSKTTAGAYCGVATLFKSVFLAEGERIHARRTDHMRRDSERAGPPILPPKDYSLIEQFIAQQFPDAVEVLYE